MATPPPHMTVCVAPSLLLDDMARSPSGYKVEWIAAHDYNTVVCGNPFRLIPTGTAFMTPADLFPVLPKLLYRYV